MSLINNPKQYTTDDAKQLKGIEKKIEDLTTASMQKPTQNTQTSNKNNLLLKPLLIVAWLFVVSYFFMKFGLTGIDTLGNLLVTTFSFLKVSTIWGFINGEMWIALMSGYTIFMIYFDILLLFPLTYLLSMKKDPMERISAQIRWEIFILILLLIPLLTTSGFYAVFGQDEADRQHNVENFQVDTKSKWTQLKEGPLCPLINLGNPQICIEKKEVVTAKKTTRVEYDIYFRKPEFTYVEDLEKWKQKPLYLNYEILAKGEPIYLERIECYQNKISPETLLSNISLENQKILSDDRTAIRGTQCNLDKATTEEITTKDYKVIALLYYYFEATYTQPIPIYNMDLYIENKYGSSEGINIISEESKIREAAKNDIKPIIPNDALGLSMYSSPSLPVFLGEDYQDRNQFTLTFTFEKKSSADKLISSEITEFKLPANFEQNCYDYDCESIIGSLSTYEDKSQIIVDFAVEDSGNERESYEDNIEFIVKSKFYSKDTITLTVKNPNAENQKTESETTTNTSTNEQTTTEAQEDTETSPIVYDSAEDASMGIDAIG